MREALVDFEQPEALVPPLTRVKSTLTCASIDALRARGLYEAYLQHLDPAQREVVLQTSGVWVSADAALAHYRACDALGLDRDTILGIGNTVTELTQRTVMTFALRLAREAGSTPWTVFERTPRVWRRLYEGSALGVFRVGPKDAEIVSVNNVLAGIRYWRLGLQGIVRALAVPFASRVFVRDPTYARALHRTEIRVSWV